MPLSRLELVREADQPADEVLLTCFDGAQTMLVSISRADLQDWARQNRWLALSPTEETSLVANNREFLLPLIQLRLDHGEATQSIDRLTGRTMPLITLQRTDLDAGIIRRTASPPVSEGEPAGTIYATRPG